MRKIPHSNRRRKAIRGLHYYDLQRRWTRKIKPHLDDKKLNAVLVRDFNKLIFGRWG